MLSLLVAALSLAQAEPVINTERPSFTNSPVVLSAGWLQLETGVNRLEDYNSGGDRRWTTQTPFLFRAGLGRALEARLGGNGYVWQGASSDRAVGFSDLQPGVKWFLAHSRGLLPDSAVILTTEFNTGSASLSHPGILPNLDFPMSWSLPARSNLTLMPGATYDTDPTGHRFWSGTTSVAVDQNWTERVGGFIEWAGQQFAAQCDGGTLSSFDAGATWAVFNDWQIDSAIWWGLNQQTPVRLFTIGLSGRFKVPHRAITPRGGQY